MTTKRRGPTAANMPKIESMSAVEARGNFLVFGDPGVGKTPFGASSPNGLVIAIDKGLISAKLAGSKAQQATINTWEEFESLTKWLRVGHASEFDWITLDGLTMAQEKCMRFFLDEGHAKSAAQDDMVPSQAIHQKVQNTMKHMVGVYCDLPVNVMFTALPWNIETEDGEERVIPLIHGQKGATSNYVTGLMDAVGYAQRTENKAGREVFRITWKPHGAYIGKDRFGTLKPFTDNPSLPELADRMNSALTGGGTTTQRRTPARRARARRSVA